jgi:hypothetical protein
MSRLMVPAPVVFAVTVFVKPWIRMGSMNVKFLNFPFSKQIWAVVPVSRIHFLRSGVA